MGGWYDTKNNRLDFNSSKINSDGALATKAIGDAFLGVAGVVEDKRKQEQLDADYKLKEEKAQIDLAKSYAETTQKAIDDTYLGYVDAKTGKFNQEQFDKDNVGLPMNQVSKEAKQYGINLERVYNNDLKQIDKEAKDAINNEALREMFKSNSKDDFTKNINPDLLDRVDGSTLTAIDSKYNTKAIEEAKLANTADKIANAVAMGNSKLENEKLKVQIEQEKLDNKKNKPKEVSAADDNQISKGVDKYFNGKYNPQTGDYTIDDPTIRKIASQVTSRASEIYKTNHENLTHSQSSRLALSEYEDGLKPPTTPEPKQKADLSTLFEKYGFTQNK